MEDEELLPGLSSSQLSGKTENGDGSFENSDSGMEDTSSKTYGLSDDAQNGIQLNHHGRPVGGHNGETLGEHCENGMYPALGQAYFVRSDNNNSVEGEQSHEHFHTSSGIMPEHPRKERYESRDTLYSSTGELSSGGGSAQLLGQPGNLRQARASMESVLSFEENGSKRPSLDYDVGSSMESLGMGRYSKTYGMSLYDEIQLANQLGEQYVMEDGTVVVLVEDNEDGEHSGEMVNDAFESEEGDETLSNEQENQNDSQVSPNQLSLEGSHDHTSESHDQTRESQDQSRESHDQSRESHDQSRESHDQSSESHDNTLGSYDQTVVAHDQTVFHLEDTIPAQTKEQEDEDVEDESESSDGSDRHAEEQWEEENFDMEEDSVDGISYSDYSSPIPPNPANPISFNDQQIPIFQQTVIEEDEEEEEEEDKRSESDTSSKQQDSTEHDATVSEEQEEVYIIMESYTVAGGGEGGEMPMSQASLAQLMAQDGMVGVQSEAGIQMMGYEDMAQFADVPYQVIMYEMPDNGDEDGGGGGDGMNAAAMARSLNMGGAQVIELDDSDNDFEIPANAIRYMQPDGTEIIMIQEEESGTEDSVSETTEGVARTQHELEIGEGLSQYSSQTDRSKSTTGMFEMKLDKDKEIQLDNSIKETVKEQMSFFAASSEDSCSVDQTAVTPRSEANGVVITELTEEEAEALSKDGITASKSSDNRNASDELLNLLDKIDKKAVETRTELKMAYVRESYLQGELEADEEHINNIVEDLNKEIETLRGENKKFYSEMTQHRTANKAYKLKITKLESVVDRLHNHTEELERQIFEATSTVSKPISVTVGSMTDKNVLMANAKSVSVMTDYVQKIGPIVKDAASLVHPHQTHCNTMTEPKSDVPQREVSVQTVSDLLCYDMGVQVGSVGILKSQESQTIQRKCSESTQQTEEEAATKSCPKMIHKSTCTRDNSNLPNGLLEESGKLISAAELADKSDLFGKKPETPDKWRRLAMTPLTSDPIVLQLQRSLATATVEYDITTAKMKKTTKEASRRQEEIQDALTKTQELLQKAKNEADALRIRWEGDRGEADVLKDKITALERELTKAQLTHQQLMQDREHERIMAQPKPVKKEDIMTQTESWVDDTEASEKKEEDTNGENVQNTVDEDSEKEQLKSEVQTLRQEFQHVQKGVEGIESLLRGGVPKAGDSSTVNRRLAELKAHIYSCQHADAPTKIPAQNGGAKSLHEDIMKQSEHVLNVLQENGAIPEKVEPEGPTVNWAEVQKSIEKQLNVESQHKLTSSQNSETSETPNMPIENRTSRVLPANVDELAAAVEKELGMKVNIVIEPVPGQTEASTAGIENGSADDIIAQTLGKKYKVDHEKMNKEYEELRKKRLSMLVQAYTGKTDTQLGLKSSNPVPVAATKVEEPNEKKELTEVEKIIVNHLGESALMQTASGASNGTDTGAIKEKLRQMREKLAKKDQQVAESADTPRSQADLFVTFREKSQTPRPRSAAQPDTAKKPDVKKIDAVDNSRRVRREIYPHKKGYMSASKYQEATESETETITTETITPEDMESLISDTDPTSDVSDPRATSLYQRTYSKCRRSPKTKRRNRSHSPAQKPQGLAQGTPMTQSFNQFPSQKPEFAGIEDTRLTASMTDLNGSDETLNGLKSSVQDYATTLQDRYKDNRGQDYKMQDTRTHGEVDGYYSSKNQVASKPSGRDYDNDGRRDWTSELYNRGGRDTMDSAFSGAYDKLDTCGCSHKDLRCTHLDFQKEQSNVTKGNSAKSSGYSEKPRQENILGGISIKGDHYGSRSRLAGSGSRERSGSKDDVYGSHRGGRSHDQRDGSYDSRERSHDYRERSHDHRERSHDHRERSHDQRERSHDQREKSHDQRERSHDPRERSHDRHKRSHDPRERSHDSKERPVLAKSMSDDSPSRNYEERPAIPSEKDYQELRTQIRRIFSESKLDQSSEYESSNNRYRSEDTLYRDGGKRPEKERFESSTDIRRKNTTGADEKYSVYDRLYSGSSSSRKPDTQRTREDSRDTYSRPRSADKSMLTKGRSTDGEREEKHNLRPRSVGYPPSSSRDDFHDKYNLRPRSVDRSSRIAEDSIEERYNLRPKSVEKTPAQEKRKTSSVASSDKDFVVLGSGDIVNRKMPQIPSERNMMRHDLDEPKWTEPKRRFLPPKESVKAPETYWKEPKRYANERAGLVDDKKEGHMWGVRSEGHERSDRRRDGDGKEVTAPAWYSSHEEDSVCDERENGSGERSNHSSSTRNYDDIVPSNREDENGGNHSSSTRNYDDMVTCNREGEIGGYHKNKTYDTVPSNRGEDDRDGYYSNKALSYDDRVLSNQEEKQEGRHNNQTLTYDDTVDSNREDRGGYHSNKSYSYNDVPSNQENNETGSYHSNPHHSYRDKPSNKDYDDDYHGNYSNTTPSNNKQGYHGSSPHSNADRTSGNYDDERRYEEKRNEPRQYDSYSSKQEQSSDYKYHTDRYESERITKNTDRQQYVTENTHHQKSSIEISGDKYDHGSKRYEQNFEDDKKNKWKTDSNENDKFESTDGYCGDSELNNSYHGSLDLKNKQNGIGNKNYHSDTEPSDRYRGNLDSEDNYRGKSVKFDVNPGISTNNDIKHEKSQNEVEDKGFHKSVWHLDKIGTDQIPEIDPELRRKVANEIIHKYTEEMDKTLKEKVVEFDAKAKEVDKEKLVETSVKKVDVEQPRIVFDNGEEENKASVSEIDEIIRKYNNDYGKREALLAQ